jgi:hypothetical protein
MALPAVLLKERLNLFFPKNYIPIYRIEKSNEKYPNECIEREHGRGIH